MSKELLLQGKTMYAFGDSIVWGYLYPEASFPNYVAEMEQMDFTNENKYAVNGASVLKHEDNWILTQVLNAPEAEPDFVLFNGGINNAYPETVPGTISEGFELEGLNNTEFAGAFEELIGTMKQKWPHAKIVYVAVHKTNKREEEIQAVLYELEMQICAKWKVPVADIYQIPEYDCLHNPECVERYAFDDLDPETGLPISKNFSGTHPNLEAIEKFFVPAVRAVLRKTAES